MLSASWYKIIGLAALQGAITLTWLIYGIYLPKLLVGYGFPAKLAITLLIIEGAIGVILEPLFGSLSDRAYRWLATKFGFVALGVIVTSAISILIPTIFVFRDVFRSVNWILPVVLVAWAMAMTIFRTPAISLMGRYAFASELPIAMSFLTVVGSFVGALRPISQDFILSLGAPFAFTIASIVLLAATALLRYFDPPLNPTVAIADSRSISLLNVSLLIGMGGGIAWGFRCLVETIPKVIKINFPQVDAALMLAFVLLASGIFAFPGGILAFKYGNKRLMLVGSGAVVVALLGMVFLPNQILIAMAILLIICCLTWVTNGVIPLAINMFPIDRSGLALGMYFGGFSGGVSSFSLLFNPVTNLTPSLGAICGSIGFTIAGICIFGSIESVDKN